MSWGYRVCKEVADDTICYSIREVYYNEGDRESIWGITESEATVSEWEFLNDYKEEDVLEGFKNQIFYLQESLKRPVIDLDTFEAEPWEEC